MTRTESSTIRAPRGGPLTSTPTNVITADQRSENRPPLIFHSPLFYLSGALWKMEMGRRKRRRAALLCGARGKWGGSTNQWKWNASHFRCAFIFNFQTVFFCWGACRIYPECKPNKADWWSTLSESISSPFFFLKKGKKRAQNKRALALNRALYFKLSSKLSKGHQRTNSDHSLAVKTG